MLLDLKIKPSKLFVQQGGEEEEPVEFDWHCKSGLAANIQTVKNEFCKERGLKPNKILITGPPASGKSKYGKMMAEHFNVPHIHVQKLIEEIDNWNSEKEEEVNRKREEKKRKEEEEERLRQEELKAEEEKAKAAAAAKADQEGEEEQKEEEPEKKEEEEQPPAEEAADGEGGEGDGEGEGEAKKKDDDDDEIETDSDAEFEEVDIKRRFREFRAENPKERYPVDLMNDAVRWRLYQNDC